MQRDKFPEKGESADGFARVCWPAAVLDSHARRSDVCLRSVPFRLTRMIVNAFEVAGIEGTFRSTAEKSMRVLRKNKNSIMAVLEAFSLDPLLNWRLLDVKKKTATVTISHGNAQQQGSGSIINNAAQVQAQVEAQTVVVGSLHSHHFITAAPHSHVATNAAPQLSDIVPLLEERALTARLAAPASSTKPHPPPPAKNAVVEPTPTTASTNLPIFGPTSILGMLVHISPSERNAPATVAAAAPAMPTTVPIAAPTAASAHAKAEASIVAGAAEPGFGSKASNGTLGAVDEGDEVSETDVSRAMPPSPAQRRRSVVDESALALGRGESNATTVRSSGPAASAAVNSRLEQLNQQAQAVMARVESKLKGTEWSAEISGAAPTSSATIRIVGFNIGMPRSQSDSASSTAAAAAPSASSSSSSTAASPPPARPGHPAAQLTVAAQVQRLIEEASSHVNLAQAYIGWSANSSSDGKHLTAPIAPMAHPSLVLCLGVAVQVPLLVSVLCCPPPLPLLLPCFVFIVNINTQRSFCCSIFPWSLCASSR